MKVIVINLDQATQRMAFQAAQLDNLGLQYSRLSANDEAHHALYEQYKGRWERPLSFAEVSCFFNHLKAWKEVLTSGKPCLIVEDDAYLASACSSLLAELDTLKDIDYISLEARGNSQKKLLARTAQYELQGTGLYRLYQGRSGAAGYVLWPEGAAKLIATFESGKIAIADKFINANYELRAYQAEPAPIIQLDKCEHYNVKAPLSTQSSIDTKDRTRATGLSTIKYKLRRLKGQFNIAINQIKHRQYCEKRALSIASDFYSKD